MLGRDVQSWLSPAERIHRPGQTKHQPLEVEVAGSGPHLGLRWQNTVFLSKCFAIHSCCIWKLLWCVRSKIKLRKQFVLCVLKLVTSSGPEFRFFFTASSNWSVHLEELLCERITDDPHASSVRWWSQENARWIACERIGSKERLFNTSEQNWFHVSLLSCSFCRSHGLVAVLFAV